MAAMNAVLLGLVVGLAGGAVGARLIQSKRNQTLSPAIEAALRDQGSLTLSQVTGALGLKGLSARGKVLFALAEMIARGKVREIPAPEGTPRRRRSDLVKYELTA